MGLPTEEDVLVVLLLWACRPVVTNCYDSAQWSERMAYNDAVRGTPEALATCARERLGAFIALGAFITIEEAIADSERRLEVERAREAVVEAVELGISMMPPSVERARTRYVLALAGLAEVSRHGG